MDYAQKLFQMPALEFTTADLQELFEDFEPDKVEHRERGGLAIAQKAIEPTSKNWTESLQLFSMY